MTACVGWPGPCDVHGEFHGCTGEHGDKGHMCDCGAKINERGLLRYVAWTPGEGPRSPSKRRSRPEGTRVAKNRNRATQEAS